MKTQKYLLQIPEPCSQDWDKMTPEGQGRFCSQCTKVVVDFSKLTDDQIISYLQNQKKEVCGRVRMSAVQLNKEYTFVYQPSKNFSTTFLRYSLAGLLTFSALKSVGQSGHNTVAVVKDNSGKNNSTKNNIVSGNVVKTTKLTIKVSDKFTGKALTNAYITIEGISETYKPTNESTFIIDASKLDKDKTYTVYISCPGKETEVRTVNLRTQGEKPLLVSMTREEMIMGKMLYVPQKDTVSKKKSCK